MIKLLHDFVFISVLDHVHLMLMNFEFQATFKLEFVLHDVLQMGRVLIPQPASQHFVPCTFIHYWHSEENKNIQQFHRLDIAKLPLMHMQNRDICCKVCSSTKILYETRFFRKLQKGAVASTRNLSCSSIIEN